jgi:hypothetical protein
MPGGSPSYFEVIKVGLFSFPGARKSVSVASSQILSRSDCLLDLPFFGRFLLRTFLAKVGE